MKAFAVILLLFIDRYISFNFALPTALSQENDDTLDPGEAQSQNRSEVIFSPHQPSSEEKAFKNIGEDENPAIFDQAQKLETHLNRNEIMLEPFSQHLQLASDSDDVVADKNRIDNYVPRITLKKLELQKIDETVVDENHVLEKMDGCVISDGPAFEVSSVQFPSLPFEDSKDVEAAQNLRNYLHNHESASSVPKTVAWSPSVLSNIETESFPKEKVPTDRALGDHHDQCASLSEENIFIAVELKGKRETPSELRQGFEETLLDNSNGYSAVETTEVITELASKTIKLIESNEKFSSLIILDELTRKKFDETVTQSEKKSFYRHESEDIPLYESPVTDESTSHPITDTGISLTRGTASSDLTGSAHIPLKVTAFTDTAVDVDIEEAELTDAGLSPIHPDIMGIQMSEMLPFDAETKLKKFCDVATSPVDLLIDGSNISSQLEVEKHDAATVTDRVETHDIGLSPNNIDLPPVLVVSNLISEGANEKNTPHQEQLDQSNTKNLSINPKNSEKSLNVSDDNLLIEEESVPGELNSYSESVDNSQVRLGEATALPTKHMQKTPMELEDYSSTIEELGQSFEIVQQADIPVSSLPLRDSESITAKKFANNESILQTVVPARQDTAEVKPETISSKLSEVVNFEQNVLSQLETAVKGKTESISSKLSEVVNVEENVLSKLESAVRQTEDTNQSDEVLTEILKIEQSLITINETLEKTFLINENKFIRKSEDTVESAGNVSAKTELKSADTDLTGNLSEPKQVEETPMENRRVPKLFNESAKNIPEHIEVVDLMTKVVIGGDDTDDESAENYSNVPILDNTAKKLIDDIFENTDLKSVSKSQPLAQAVLENRIAVVEELIIPKKVSSHETETTELETFKLLEMSIDKSTLFRLEEERREGDLIIEAIRENLDPVNQEGGDTSNEAVELVSNNFKEVKDLASSNVRTSLTHKSLICSTVNDFHEILLPEISDLESEISNLENVLYNQAERFPSGNQNDEALDIADYKITNSNHLNSESKSEKIMEQYLESSPATSFFEVSSTMSAQEKFTDRPHSAPGEGTQSVFDGVLSLNDAHINQSQDQVRQLDADKSDLVVEPSNASSHFAQTSSDVKLTQLSDVENCLTEGTKEREAGNVIGCKEDGSECIREFGECYSGEPLSSRITSNIPVFESQSSRVNDLEDLEARSERPPEPDENDATRENQCTQDASGQLVPNISNQDAILNPLLSGAGTMQDNLPFRSVSQDVRDKLVSINNSAPKLGVDTLTSQDPPNLFLNDSNMTEEADSSNLLLLSEKCLPSVETKSRDATEKRVHEYTSSNIDPIKTYSCDQILLDGKMLTEAVVEPIKSVEKVAVSSESPIVIDLTAKTKDAFTDENSVQGLVSPEAKCQGNYEIELTAASSPKFSWHDWHEIKESDLQVTAEKLAGGNVVESLKSIEEASFIESSQNIPEKQVEMYSNVSVNDELQTVVTLFETTHDEEMRKEILELASSKIKPQNLEPKPVLFDTTLANQSKLKDFERNEESLTSVDVGIVFGSSDEIVNSSSGSDGIQNVGVSHETKLQEDSRNEFSVYPSSEPKKDNVSHSNQLDKNDKSIVEDTGKSLELVDEVSRFTDFEKNHSNTSSMEKSSVKTSQTGMHVFEAKREGGVEEEALVPLFPKFKSETTTQLIQPSCEQNVENTNESLCIGEKVSESADFQMVSKFLEERNDNLTVLEKIDIVIPPSKNKNEKSTITGFPEPIPSKIELEVDNVCNKFVIKETPSESIEKSEVCHEEVFRSGNIDQSIDESFVRKMKDNTSENDKLELLPDFKRSRVIEGELAEQSSLKKVSEEIGVSDYLSGNGESGIEAEDKSAECDGGVSNYLNYSVAQEISVPNDEFLTIQDYVSTQEESPKDTREKTIAIVSAEEPSHQLNLEKFQKLNEFLCDKEVSDTIKIESADSNISRDFVVVKQSDAIADSILQETMVNLDAKIGDHNKENPIGSSSHGFKTNETHKLQQLVGHGELDSETLIESFDFSQGVFHTENSSVLIKDESDDDSNSHGRIQSVVSLPDPGHREYLKNFSFEQSSSKNNVKEAESYDQYLRNKKSTSETIVETESFNGIALNLLDSQIADFPASQKVENIKENIPEPPPFKSSSAESPEFNQQVYREELVFQTLDASTKSQELPLSVNTQTLLEYSKVMGDNSTPNANLQLPVTSSETAVEIFDEGNKLEHSKPEIKFKGVDTSDDLYSDKTSDLQVKFDVTKSDEDDVVSVSSTILQEYPKAMMDVSIDFDGLRQAVISASDSVGIKNVENELPKLSSLPEEASSQSSSNVPFEKPKEFDHPITQETSDDISSINKVNKIIGEEITDSFSSEFHSEKTRGFDVISDESLNGKVKVPFLSDSEVLKQENADAESGDIVNDESEEERIETVNVFPEDDRKESYGKETPKNSSPTIKAMENFASGGLVGDETKMLVTEVVSILRNEYVIESKNSDAIVEDNKTRLESETTDACLQAVDTLRKTEQDNFIDSELLDLSLDSEPAKIEDTEYPVSNETLTGSFNVDALATSQHLSTLVDSESILEHSKELVDHNTIDGSVLNLNLLSTTNLEIVSGKEFTDFSLANELEEAYESGQLANFRAGSGVASPLFNVELSDPQTNELQQQTSEIDMKELPVPETKLEETQAADQILGNTNLVVESEIDPKVLCEMVSKSSDFETNSELRIEVSDRKGVGFRTDNADSMPENYFKEAFSQEFPLYPPETKHDETNEFHHRSGAANVAAEPDSNSDGLAESALEPQGSPAKAQDLVDVDKGKTIAQTVDALLEIQREGAKGAELPKVPEPELEETKKIDNLISDRSSMIDSKIDPTTRIGESIDRTPFEIVSNLFGEQTVSETVDVIQKTEVIVLGVLHNESFDGESIELLPESESARSNEVYSQFSDKKLVAETTTNLNELIEHESEQVDLVTQSRGTTDSAPTDVSLQTVAPSPKIKDVDSVDKQSLEDSLSETRLKGTNNNILERPVLQNSEILVKASETLDSISSDNNESLNVTMVSASIYPSVSNSLDADITFGTSGELVVLETDDHGLQTSDVSSETEFEEVSEGKQPDFSSPKSGSVETGKADHFGFDMNLTNRSINCIVSIEETTNLVASETIHEQFKAPSASKPFDNVWKSFEISNDDEETIEVETPALASFGTLSKECEEPNHPLIDEYLVAESSVVSGGSLEEASKLAESEIFFNRFDEVSGCIAVEETLQTTKLKKTEESSLIQDVEILIIDSTVGSFVPSAEVLESEDSEICSERSGEFIRSETLDGSPPTIETLPETKYKRAAAGDSTTSLSRKTLVPNIRDDNLVGEETALAETNVSFSESIKDLDRPEVFLDTHEQSGMKTNDQALGEVFKATINPPKMKCEESVEQEFPEISVPDNKSDGITNSFNFVTEDTVSISPGVSSIVTVGEDCEGTPIAVTHENVGILIESETVNLGSQKAQHSTKSQLGAAAEENRPEVSSIKTQPEENETFLHLQEPIDLKSHDEKLQSLVAPLSTVHEKSIDQEAVVFFSPNNESPKQNDFDDVNEVGPIDIGDNDYAQSFKTVFPNIHEHAVEKVDGSTFLCSSIPNESPPIEEPDEIAHKEIPALLIGKSVKKTEKLDLVASEDVLNLDVKMDSFEVVSKLQDGTKLFEFEKEMNDSPFLDNLPRTMMCQTETDSEEFFGEQLRGPIKLKVVADSTIDFHSSNDVEKLEVKVKEESFEIIRENINLNNSKNFECLEKMESILVCDSGLKTNNFVSQIEHEGAFKAEPSQIYSPQVNADQVYELDEHTRTEIVAEKLKNFSDSKEDFLVSLDVISVHQDARKGLDSTIDGSLSDTVPTYSSPAKKYLEKPLESDNLISDENLFRDAAIKSLASSEKVLKYVNLESNNYSVVAENDSCVTSNLQPTINESEPKLEEVFKDELPVDNYRVMECDHMQECDHVVSREPSVTNGSVQIGASVSNFAVSDTFMNNGELKDGTTAYTILETIPASSRDERKDTADINFVEPALAQIDIIQPEEFSSLGSDTKSGTESLFEADTPAQESLKLAKLETVELKTITVYDITVKNSLQTDPSPQKSYITIASEDECKYSDPIASTINRNATEDFDSIDSDSKILVEATFVEDSLQSADVKNVEHKRKESCISMIDVIPLTDCTLLEANDEKAVQSLPEMQVNQSKESDQPIIQAAFVFEIDSGSSKLSQEKTEPEPPKFVEHDEGKKSYPIFDGSTKIVAIHVDAKSKKSSEKGETKQSATKPGEDVQGDFELPVNVEKSAGAEITAAIESKEDIPELGNLGNVKHREGSKVGASSNSSQPPFGVFETKIVDSFDNQPPNESLPKVDLGLIRESDLYPCDTMPVLEPLVESSDLADEVLKFKDYEAVEQINTLEVGVTLSTSMEAASRLPEIERSGASKNENLEEHLKNIYLDQAKEVNYHVSEASIFGEPLVQTRGTLDDVPKTLQFYNKECCEDTTFNLTIVDGFGKIFTPSETKKENQYDDACIKQFLHKVESVQTNETDQVVSDVKLVSQLNEDKSVFANIENVASTEGLKDNRTAVSNLQTTISSSTTKIRKLSKDDVYDKAVQNLHLDQMEESGELIREAESDSQICFETFDIPDVSKSPKLEIIRSREDYVDDLKVGESSQTSDYRKENWFKKDFEDHVPDFILSSLGLHQANEADQGADDVKSRVESTMPFIESRHEISKSTDLDIVEDWNGMKESSTVFENLQTDFVPSKSMDFVLFQNEPANSLSLKQDEDFSKESTLLHVFEIDSKTSKDFDQIARETESVVRATVETSETRETALKSVDPNNVKIESDSAEGITATNSPSTVIESSVTKPKEDLCTGLSESSVIKIDANRTKDSCLVADEILLSTQISIGSTESRKDVLKSPLPDSAKLRDDFENDVLIDDLKETTVGSTEETSKGTCEHRLFNTLAPKTESNNILKSDDDSQFISERDEEISKSNDSTYVDHGGADMNSKIFVEDNIQNVFAVSKTSVEEASEVENFQYSLFKIELDSRAELTPTEIPTENPVTKLSEHNETVLNLTCSKNIELKDDSRDRMLSADNLQFNMDSFETKVEESQEGQLSHSCTVQEGREDVKIVCEKELIVEVSLKSIESLEEVSILTRLENLALGENIVDAVVDTSNEQKLISSSETKGERVIGHDSQESYFCKIKSDPLSTSDPLRTDKTPGYTGILEPSKPSETLSETLTSRIDEQRKGVDNSLGAVDNLQIGFTSSESGFGGACIDVFADPFLPKIGQHQINLSDPSIYDAKLVAAAKDDFSESVDKDTKSPNNFGSSEWVEEVLDNLNDDDSLQATYPSPDSNIEEKTPKESIGRPVHENEFLALESCEKSVISLKKEKVTCTKVSMNSAYEVAECSFEDLLEPVIDCIPSLSHDESDEKVISVKKITRPVPSKLVDHHASVSESRDLKDIVDITHLDLVMSNSYTLDKEEKGLSKTTDASGLQGKDGVAESIQSVFQVSTLEKLCKDSLCVTSNESQSSYVFGSSSDEISAHTVSSDVEEADCSVVTLSGGSSLNLLEASTGPSIQQYSQYFVTSEENSLQSEVRPITEASDQSSSSQPDTSGNSKSPDIETVSSFLSHGTQEKEFAEAICNKSSACGDFDSNKLKTTLMKYSRTEQDPPEFISKTAIEFDESATDQEMKLPSTNNIISEPSSVDDGPSGKGTVKDNLIFSDTGDERNSIFTTKSGATYVYAKSSGATFLCSCDEIESTKDIFLKDKENFDHGDDVESKTNDFEVSEMTEEVKLNEGVNIKRVNVSEVDSLVQSIVTSSKVTEVYHKSTMNQVEKGFRGQLSKDNGITEIIPNNRTNRPSLPIESDSAGILNKKSAPSQKWSYGRTGSVGNMKTSEYQSKNSLKIKSREEAGIAKKSQIPRIFPTSSKVKSQTDKSTKKIDFSPQRSSKLLHCSEGKKTNEKNYTRLTTNHVELHHSSVDEIHGDKHLRKLLKPHPSSTAVQTHFTVEYSSSIIDNCRPSFSLPLFLTEDTSQSLDMKKKCAQDLEKKLSDRSVRNETSQSGSLNESTDTFYRKQSEVQHESNFDRNLNDSKGQKMTKCTLRKRGYAASTLSASMKTKKAEPCSPELRAPVTSRRLVKKNKQFSHSQSISEKERKQASNSAVKMKKTKVPKSESKVPSSKREKVEENVLENVHSDTIEPVTSHLLSLGSKEIQETSFGVSCDIPSCSSNPALSPSKKKSSCVNNTVQTLKFYKLSESWDDIKRASSAPPAVHYSIIDADRMQFRRQSDPKFNLDHPSSFLNYRGSSSLTSSPCHTRRSSGGMSHFLTSEVFTQTNSSGGLRGGSLEVVFHRPSDSVPQLTHLPCWKPKIENFESVTWFESSKSDRCQTKLSSPVLSSHKSGHLAAQNTATILKNPVVPMYSSHDFPLSLSSNSSTDGKSIHTVRDLQDEKVQSCVRESGSKSSSESTLVVTNYRPNEESKFSRNNERNSAEESIVRLAKSPGKVCKQQLSPIFQVRAKTPPRLKHTFKYLPSDEESPSSSPELLKSIDPANLFSHHRTNLPEVETWQQNAGLKLLNECLQNVSLFDSDSLNSTLLGQSEDILHQGVQSKIGFDPLQNPTVKKLCSNRLLCPSQNRELFLTNEQLPPQRGNHKYKESTSHHLKEINQVFIPMELSRSQKVPVIAITPDDDGPKPLSLKTFQRVFTPEPVTDTEDLEAFHDQSTLKIIKLDVDDSSLTDVEDMQASDEEENKEKTFYRYPKTFSFDDVIDAGSFEESISMKSKKNGLKKLFSSFTRSLSEPTYRLRDLKTPVTDAGESTDVELIDSDIEAEHSFKDDHSVLLNHLLDSDAVLITEQDKWRSATPSPCVTPEPLTSEGKIKKLTKKSSKGRSSDLLSPRSLSPHLSDFTDTEIIYSDNEEGQFDEYLAVPVSRLKKPKRARRNNVYANSSVYIAEIEHQPRPLDYNTETEDMELTDREEMSPIPSRNVPFKEITAKRPRKFQPSSKQVVMDMNTYGSHGEGGVTDEEDFCSDAEDGLIQNNSTVPGIKEHYDRCMSPKRDDFEIRFMDINGGKIPLAVTSDTVFGGNEMLRNCAADVENLSDDERHVIPTQPKATAFLSVNRALKNPYILTDTVDIDYDGELCRSKSPEPELEDEDSELLAQLLTPIREIHLVKEDESGAPSRIVLPLGDANPTGLLPPHEETGGASEIEDVIDSSDELQPTEYQYQSPDISDIDGGFIKSSDVVKTLKKKNRLSVDLQNMDPLTDTEEILVSSGSSSGGRRKKNKTKSKSLYALKVPDIGISGSTDTEEVIFSDTEGNRILEIPSVNISAPVECVEDIAAVTDLEEMEASDDGEEREKSVSVTPDCLRSLSNETITFMKENDSSFSKEVKHNFFKTFKESHWSDISTPELQLAPYTDTEELLESAAEDEEQKLSSQHCDYNLDLEDGFSTTVHTKHIRSFILDQNELMHVKGATTSARDANTDVEEMALSEDEVLNLLSVHDSEKNVCICIQSADDCKICVCVARDDNELSLVWESNSLPVNTSVSKKGTCILTSRSKNRPKSRSCTCCKKPELFLSVDTSEQFSLPRKKYLGRLEPPCRNLSAVLYFVSLGTYSGLVQETISCTSEQYDLWLNSKTDGIHYLLKKKSNGCTYKIQVNKLIASHSFSIISSFYVEHQLDFELSRTPLISTSSTPLNERKSLKTYERSFTSGFISSKQREKDDMLFKRSSSVTKLIEKFETMTFNFIPFLEGNNAILSHDYTSEDKCDEMSIISNWSLSKMIEDKPTPYNSSASKYFSKPVIKFECLKDRSVSPQRLHPAPIVRTAAFQAIYKKSGINV